jgi:hypothetical protein
MAVVALAGLGVGGGVYAAGRYAPKAIAWLALILATIVPLILEVVAAYQFYMAATGSFKYAFADMGFAIVTAFNLVWLPAMGFCHWLGRRRRARMIASQDGEATRPGW